MKLGLCCSVLANTCNPHSALAGIIFTDEGSAFLGACLYSSSLRLVMMHDLLPPPPHRSRCMW